MIKTTELRRGNLINEEVLGWVTVHEVFENSASVLAKHMDIDRRISDVCYTLSFGNMDGIPLTPEILEKFGFVKYEYGANLFSIHLEVENWKLVYEQYKGGEVQFYIQADGGYDEYGLMDIINKCKYVHQLQNLYFALTGEELNYQNTTIQNTTQ